MVSRRYWEQVCSCKVKVFFDPFHAETLRLDNWLHQPTDADLDRDPERLRRHRRADLDRLPDDTFVTSCPNSVVLVSTGSTAALGLAPLRETDKRLPAAAVRPARFCAILSARCCGTSTSRRERRASWNDSGRLRTAILTRTCRHWCAPLSLTG